ncbi:hypothetical protein AOQ84DRAFT_132710 [Glonium stellatum]|uniref:Uncharacterized protein n=1 Tax=Glonium stellatum TaxID=574774 RepID=A0A8E2F988_9PEZI|nr:hypothetical protein AOQ84DRAFT_132710 [Glonium stellatum]
MQYVAHDNDSYSSTQHYYCRHPAKHLMLLFVIKNHNLALFMIFFNRLPSSKNVTGLSNLIEKWRDLLKKLSLCPAIYIVGEINASADLGEHELTRVRKKSVLKACPSSAKAICCYWLTPIRETCIPKHSRLLLLYYDGLGGPIEASTSSRIIESVTSDDP